MPHSRERLVRESYQIRKTLEEFDKSYKQLCQYGIVEGGARQDQRDRYWSEMKPWKVKSESWKCHSNV